MTPIVRYQQRGATLLEALIALGLMGIMMAMGARQLNGFQHQLKDQVASQHLKQVTEAAADYLRANAATVAATATNTTAAVISVTDLINGGFLPAGFRAQNPYNQTARVEVLEPTANELQALVLYTGGDTLTGVQAPAIAVRAGAAGGYVPSDNPGVAQGAYGGWQVSLAGYTNPGPNKLAAFLYFDNGNLANDYLYRHAVPGKPELNKMFTALDMGDQDINNAKIATARQVRINGNNAGTSWSDTDLVIGDSSVNRHDSSLSIMSSSSALKLQAVGDTLNLRQWQGVDIANFNTRSVTTGGDITVGGVARAGGYSGGAGNINTFSLEVGGGNPTTVGNQASILFHHWGVLANQLRYNNGNLYWEAAGNGYGTTSAPNLNVGGRVSGNTLLARATATKGAACSTTGELAQDSTNGSMLSCLNTGVWGAAQGASGGTGLSGVFAPLKGMEISCNMETLVTSKEIYYGTVNAKLDANGIPYARAYITGPHGTSDSGWVQGLSAEAKTSYYSFELHGPAWQITSADFSTTSLRGRMSVYDPNHGTVGSTCGLLWPLT